MLKFSERYRLLMEVAVIGTGRLGSAVVEELVKNEKIDEILIINRDRNTSAGLRMDIMSSNSQYPEKLRVADYKDAGKADIVILTAGKAQEKGQAREGLLTTNVIITEEILSKIKEFKPSAKFIIATNPVDVICNKAMRLSGLPAGQVFGFGGDLDAERLKLLIASKTHKEANSIEAHIIGSHGELAIPITKEAIPFRTIRDMQQYAMDVIERIGATAYGPANKISELVDDIINDRKNMHHVSYFNKKEGIYETGPCIISKEGVAEIIELPLTTAEKREQEQVRTHLKQLDAMEIKPRFEITPAILRGLIASSGRFPGEWERASPPHKSTKEKFVDAFRRFNERIEEKLHLGEEAQKRKVVKVR
jgi:L-lactate dehydrogenase